MNYAHLFYPANDVALSANTYNYTPPKAAVTLFKAGETLPLWYGSAGDICLCSGVNEQWYKAMRERFGIEVEPTLCLNAMHQYTPRPWGWSRASKQALEDLGFAPHTLPDEEALALIRYYSSRETAARLAHILKQNLDFETTETAVPAIMPGEALQMVEKLQGNAMIKTPWSNAGRGVFPAHGMNSETLSALIKRLIDKHGVITIEPHFNKLLDFAMLFVAQPDGKVDYHGLSMFNVNDGGTYTGNLVMSHAEIEGRLCRFISTQQLEDTVGTLSVLLSKYLQGAYSGPLGIDMMVVKTKKDKALLNPMVELNLRNTMGHVAMNLMHKVMHPQAKGVLRCVKNNMLATNEKPFQGAHFTDDRLSGGVFTITPPGGEMCFSLEIC